MYILKNKIKFLSILHARNKLNLLFISLLFLSILGVYIKDYNDAILMFFILVCLKISHMYIEMNNYYKKIDYIKWLEFRDTEFIQKILRYSKYIFYPLSISILTILFYKFYNYGDGEYFFKIFSVLSMILYLIIIMIYYTLSIKFKQ